MNQSDEIIIPLENVEQLLEPCPPSPFRRRRLREEAEQYIIEHAIALPRHARAKLVISLPQSRSINGQMITNAVHQHFNFRRLEAEKKLSNTRRFGWRTLIVRYVACFSRRSDSGFRGRGAGICSGVARMIAAMRSLNSSTVSTRPCCFIRE
jgi:hypothetical protein